MGAIGGLLGLNGGAAGTGFGTPALAATTNPTTAGQLSTAYSGNQAALTSQQNLLNALNAQNGIGNQSQVYGQEQAIASGNGPNPAAASLAQSTGANVANQAALNAGARGSSGNVGLMTRQNAQQGATTQQAAAGQAATMEAQQELSALGTAGTIAGTQAGNQIAGTNANTAAENAEQANLLNANQGYNTNTVAAQSNINNANSSLANTSMQGQQGLVGGVLQGAGSILGSLAEGGEVDEDTDEIQEGSPAGAPPAPKSSSGGGGGGLMALMALMANGGDTTGMLGADTDLSGPNGIDASPSAQSSFGQFLSSFGKKVSKGNTNNQPQSAPQATTGPGALQTGMASLVSGLGNLAGYSKGGSVKALVSPGEKLLSPAKVEQVKKGANPMKVGETVPGKPKVGGAKNSYANDTHPAKLAVGTIVVPRSETKSKNPERDSADFVRKVLAKRKK